MIAVSLSTLAEKIVKGNDTELKSIIKKKQDHSILKITCHVLRRNRDKYGMKSIKPTTDQYKTFVKMDKKM